ncbi:hypothetical protein K474DRAFT_1634064 [Panus rudis PR-1116 ss-1]|nr:hypothetical protein K474DRAFT_1634064 [Panus rudis PR-1116 ss-1]
MVIAAKRSDNVQGFLEQLYTELRCLHSPLRAMSGAYSRYTRVHDPVLPSPSTSSEQGSRSTISAWTTRRNAKRITILLAIFFLFCTALLRLWPPQLPTPIASLVDESLPPLYEQYHQEELGLPQHNPDLPFPEGREGRYVFIANHVYGLGWGNAMQQVLLDSFLAYKSGRAYVFDNYTWNRDLDPPPYSEYNGKLIPSRIPLRALIVGPTAGGPFPPGDPAPRAVGVEYYKSVCPQSMVLNADAVYAEIGGDPTAAQVMDKWVNTFNSIQDRCIEVSRFSDNQIFNYWIFGDPNRLLDIWPEYKESPIIKQFRWSPLVHAAFEKNYRLFTTPSSLGSFFSYLRPESDPYQPIPGLLALHIRRGDFEEHCHHLAKWSARYSGFNSFPEFLDKFDPPPGSGGGNANSTAVDTYIKHCFPSIDQIVARVEEIRNSPSGKGLKNIYVMTNGPRPWVAKLKSSLRKSGHWDKIAASRDLALTPEQKYIGQAIDMLIGQRAQVLIGNGFSSMTANIVMLRMARKDLSPDTNRFW